MPIFRSNLKLLDVKKYFVYVSAGLKEWLYAYQQNIVSY